MSTTASVPAPTAPTQIVVTSPAASTAHPDHAQLILGAILAALQAAVPVFINILPPAEKIALEIGEVGLGTTVSVLGQIQQGK